ncbi:MAG: fibronectin type III domain-containing protein [Sphingobacteriales bacterium]|nr:MAG: fibronectin type III domain-containing protein [Sphingobacteriales bacterium]
MKKIILLLMLVSVFFGYSQENFESGVPPTGWVKATRLNGATVTSGPGTGFTWQANIAAYPPYEGAISAYINNENIYNATTNPTLPSTEEDWLISSQQLIPANGQVRFFVKQTTLGEQNTTFKIMVSTTSQTDLSTFTQLKSFTEQELNDQTDNSVLEYDLRSADFPTALFNQNVYIAFVRQYTQTTTARNGERFLIDLVSVVQKCPPPTNLTVAGITSTTANLSWTAPTGQNNFQVVILPETDPFTAAGAFPVTGASYAATGLTAGVAYKYYVRTNCGSDNFSDWVGPLNFVTKPTGTYCNAPIVINGLPFQTSNNTGNYGNFFSTSQGTTCGATPAGTYKPLPCR